MRAAISQLLFWGRQKFCGHKPWGGKGKFFQIIAHTPRGRDSVIPINKAEWHFVGLMIASAARPFNRH